MNNMNSLYGMSDMECIVTGAICGIVWCLLVWYLYRTQPLTFDEEYELWLDSLKTDLNTYNTHNND